MSNHWSANADPDNLDLAYQDTVALLQTELDKLEQENRLLREANAAAVHTPPVDTSALERQYEERLASLNQELQVREDNINWLLDQMQMLEQTILAHRQDREQLMHWLTEIEKRVETHVEAISAAPSEELTREVSELKRRLDAVQRESDQKVRTLENEKRHLEAQKQQLQAELDRLSGQVVELTETLQTVSAQAQEAMSGQADAPEFGEDGVSQASIIEALEEENRRLRQTCVELTRASAQVEEFEALQNQLAELQTHYAAAYHELETTRQQLQDQIKAAEEEKAQLIKAHEIEKAELEARIAREVQQAQRLAEEQQRRAAASRDTSIDERIRAFREHLQELQSREEADKKHSTGGFAKRISQVWVKTRPR